jgi:hypothetical protein
MSDTPVGERPSTGGRVRQFNSDAERARAWREAQKQRRMEAPGAAVPPGLAEATLSSVLERLSEVFAANHVNTGHLVVQVEEAIAALADPEAVAEEMETVRAETARQVAEAQERLARAQQAKAGAEHAARDAENAANAAWEQAEALSVQLEQERSARRLADEAAVQARDAFEGARLEYTAVVGELERAHAQALDELAAVHGIELEAQRDVYEQAAGEIAARHHEELAEMRVEAGRVVEAAQIQVAEAGRARARAEGVAAELREELDRSRSELERSRNEFAELYASVPVRVEAAEVAVADNLAIRYRLELDATTANYEGQVGRLQAQLESATAQAASAERIAEVYQREAQLLSQQLDQQPRREGRQERSDN